MRAFLVVDDAFAPGVNLARIAVHLDHLVGWEGFHAVERWLAKENLHPAVKGNHGHHRTVIATRDGVDFLRERIKVELLGKKQHPRHLFPRDVWTVDEGNAVKCLEVFVGGNPGFRCEVFNQALSLHGHDGFLCWKKVIPCRLPKPHGGVCGPAWDRLKNN